MPRLRVILNGQILAGAYEAEVNSNNHYSANTFGVLVALGPDNDWADAEFWSSQISMEIIVQLSIDGGQSFSNLIQGMVDTAQLDPIQKEVHIQGRDLTVLLLESQSWGTFANQTASEIATIIANRHNFIPMIAPTDTPVGRFYESDHESVLLNTFSKITNEWDLLVYLAQQENFDVFMNGSFLCFRPISSLAEISRVIRPLNVEKLKLNRALSLAGEVQITVKSWNSQLQAGFASQVNGIVNTSSSNTPNSSVPTLRRVFIHPNLTPDRAAALAMRYFSEITRHERTVEFSMPGDLELSPGNVILLNGTETDFDQAYYIDSIYRTFRIKTGFEQHVRASNSSPRMVTVADSMD